MSIRIKRFVTFALLLTVLFAPFTCPPSAVALDNDSQKPLWIPGAVGSFISYSGNGEIIPSAAGYAYTEEIFLAKAGTKVSFTDSKPPFADNSAYVFSVRRGDSAVTGFTGANPFVYSDGKSGRTYTYISSCDGESLRLCYHSGARRYTLPQTTPEINITYTDSVCGSLESYTDSGFCGFENILSADWSNGYAASDGSINFYNQNYRITEVITVPRAGTKISWKCSNRNCPIPGSVFAISSWKDSGDKWVFDSESANLTGDLFEFDESDGAYIYSYTTTNENECLRISANTDGYDLPCPLIYAVYDIDSYILRLADGLSVTTLPGASIRVGCGAEDSGIRFLTGVDSAAYNKLASLVGKKNIVTGTVIAPKQFTDAADGFTKERLDTLDVASAKYVDVVSDKWFSESDRTYCFAGSIVKIYPEHFSLEFSAAGYVTIAYDGKLITVYSPTCAVRSVAYVAQSALSDTSDGQNEKYLYPLENGKYGKYSPR